MTSQYFTHDIRDELYREVLTLDSEGKVKTRYRIDKPRTLIIREGGTTHKVIDADGLVHMYHYVPGVIVRWMPKNKTKPVKF